MIKLIFGPALESKKKQVKLVFQASCIFGYVLFVEMGPDPTRPELTFVPQ